MLTTEAAFIGFQILAKSRGVKYRTVPYKNWHYDLPALAAHINENTKIIYLANPNNPTGTIFTRHEFDDFYRHVPERVLIILDEASLEYAQDNPRYPDSMHYRYDNVITLRTFSKIYGLAGCASARVRARGTDRQSAQSKIAVRNRVRGPVAGIGALGGQGVSASLARIECTRPAASHRFLARDGG